jgi:hypothetical protein
MPQPYPPRLYVIRTMFRSHTNTTHEINKKKKQKQKNCVCADGGWQAREQQLATEDAALTARLATDRHEPLAGPLMRTDGVTLRAPNADVLRELQSLDSEMRLGALMRTWKTPGRSLWPPPESPLVTYSSRVQIYLAACWAMQHGRVLAPRRGWRR